MGEQLRPMGTFAPWTTTPMLWSNVAMPGAPDVVVLSQHALVAAKAVVAAARMVKEEMRMVSLENILAVLVVLLGS